MEFPTEEWVGWDVMLGPLNTVNMSARNVLILTDLFSLDVPSDVLFSTLKTIKNNPDIKFMFKTEYEDRYTELTSGGATVLSSEGLEYPINMVKLENDNMRVINTQKERTNDFDGGKHNFYDIPPYVHNVDSLCQYLKATGPIFNIVKGCFSVKGDRHSGTDALRDAKKIVHYAIRHQLDTELYLNNNLLSEKDIYLQLINKLPDEDKVWIKNNI